MQIIHAGLKAAGLDVFAVLRDNDAYHALKAADGLMVTGPAGTNVNDVAAALPKAHQDKLPGFFLP